MGTGGVHGKCEESGLRLRGAQLFSLDEGRRRHALALLLVKRCRAKSGVRLAVGIGDQKCAGSVGARGGNTSTNSKGAGNHHDNNASKRRWERVLCAGPAAGRTRDCRQLSTQGALLSNLLGRRSLIARRARREAVGRIARLGVRLDEAQRNAESGEVQGKPIMACSECMGVDDM